MYGRERRIRPRRLGLANTASGLQGSKYGNQTRGRTHPSRSRVQRTWCRPRQSQVPQVERVRVTFAGAAVVAAAIGLPSSIGLTAGPSEVSGSRILLADCPPGWYVNSSGNCVEPPDQNPSNPTAICCDGTESHSQHRSGTCSGHGGSANGTARQVTPTTPTTGPPTNSAGCGLEPLWLSAALQRIGTGRPGRDRRALCGAVTRRPLTRPLPLD